MLTFISAPDFEIPTDSGGDNTYVVIVSATDAGGSGNSDTQTLNVTVTDDPGENNAPVITSDGGGAAASVNAAENQTAVTTVTATDPDADTVTFSITGGEDQGDFSIVPATGVLTLARRPTLKSQPTALHPEAIPTSSRSPQPTTEQAPSQTCRPLPSL